MKEWFFLRRKSKYGVGFVWVVRVVGFYWCGNGGVREEVYIFFVFG